ncbi:MAG: hypothetical protein IT410_03700 [Candidatus Doudnabacteria bacterium]|nr:hypothetical protein [Candidatus Doudnabacteria bacterium]
MEKREFDPEKHKILSKQEGGGFVRKTALSFEDAQDEALKIQEIKDTLVNGEGWIKRMAYEAANAIVAGGGEIAAVAVVENYVSATDFQKACKEEKLAHENRLIKLKEAGITFDYLYDYDVFTGGKYDINKIVYNPTIRYFSRFTINSVGPVLDPADMNQNVYLNPSILNYLVAPANWKSINDQEAKFAEEIAAKSDGADSDIRFSIRNRIESVAKLQKLPQKTQDALLEYSEQEDSLARDLSIYQRAGLISAEQSINIIEARKKGEEILEGVINGINKFPIQSEEWPQHAKYWAIIKRKPEKEVEKS